MLTPVPLPQVSGAINQEYSPEPMVSVGKESPRWTSSSPASLATPWEWVTPALPLRDCREIYGA